MKISKVIFFSTFFWSLLVCDSLAQNTVLKQIPILKLKNNQVQTLIDTHFLNSKGTNRSNVIFISLCKIDGYQYLFFDCVNKGYMDYLATETEFRSQQLVGFLEISNTDCFVFGDCSVNRFFRQTKDSFQIPRKWKWLSEISNVKYMDDLFNHISLKNDDSDVVYCVTFDIQRYVYRKGTFEDINSLPKFSEIYSDFRNANRLGYRR